MTKRIVLLQALASTPADLARTLDGIDEAAARRPPASGEWSVADVVNHLIDVEQRYRERLRRVVREERPMLPAIRPDEAAHDPDAALGELLGRFEGARAQTLAFLGELSPADWQRPADHETWGETHFRFLVHNLADHDTLHLNQLAEVRQRLGVAAFEVG